MDSDSPVLGLRIPSQHRKYMTLEHVHLGDYLAAMSRARYGLEATDDQQKKKGVWRRDSRPQCPFDHCGCSEIGLNQWLGS